MRSQEKRAGNSRGSRLDGEVRSLDSATRFPEALPVEPFSAGIMPGIRLASASKRPPRRHHSAIVEMQRRMLPMHNGGGGFIPLRHARWSAL